MTLLACSDAIQPRTVVRRDLARMLGHELRHVRKQLRWTRKQLHARLVSDISLQTLATYELGTRQCSVIRFVELCTALGAWAPDVLSQAIQQARDVTPPGCVDINLQAVLRDTTSALFPLRRWARQRLTTTPDALDTVRLDAATLERLAELCRMTLPDLARSLIVLGATPAHQLIDPESGHARHR